jgi:hypothetical protein
MRPVALLYWLTLVAWLASLVAGGATAMAAFSTLPALDAFVPSAAEVFGEPGPASGRYAAGFVAQAVFDLTATLQLVCAGVLGLLLLIQRFGLRWPDRGLANLLREGCILVAIGVAGYQGIVLGPSMNVSLSDYRNAVRAGDAASAAEHQAIFDRGHRIADPLLRTATFALLGALLLSAWTMTPRRPLVD